MSSSPKVERKLAAIMFTDIVGYTELSSTDEEKAFNQVTLYGKDTDIVSIISESKQYPFSANFRIVIVKEAQHIRSIEKLESYIENHLKSTILVICYKGKTLDKRKKVTTNILKTGVLFESKSLYENQISIFEYS